MRPQELRRSSVFLLRAGAFSALSLLACVGHIGGSAETGTGGGAGTGGSGPSSGAGSSTGGGATGATTGDGGGVNPTTGSGGTPGVAIVTTGAAPAESAGTLVMRRLTYREYDHMLADLLGDTTAPAEGGNAWSPDAPNAVGYVAPASVADLQVDLYNQTANTVVETALQALAAGQSAGKLSIPCKTPTTSAAETTCATQFITAFGLEAYRRPVAAAEQTDLLTLFTKVRGLGLSFNESIGAIVKSMIQSPNFLYHWEIGPTPPVVGSDGLVPLTPWQLASRLASTIWETTPDDTLLQAAQSGQLSTPAQVASQVTRMLADPRSANGLFYFTEQWLFNFGSQGRDLTQPLTKSSPLFTTAVAQGIPTEFSDFVSSVYTGDGTLKSLFTAPYTYVNHDLGAIYGVTGPATGFAKVSLDATKRGGIFTQTAFLATLASDGADNPIYRGLSIYLKVLCGTMGSPPANVPAVTFIANGTTRQSYDAHGMSGCAAGCHNLFDPPGFSFENFDGNGSYRTTDANQPVDATGSFVTPANATITFQNALDLSTQLAQSAEAQTCVDRQWTRFILGRPETAAESGLMSLAFQKAAATAGFSLRDSMATLIQSKAFMYRLPSPGEAIRVARNGQRAGRCGKSVVAGVVAVVDAAPRLRQLGRRRSDDGRRWSTRIGKRRHCHRGRDGERRSNRVGHRRERRRRKRHWRSNRVGHRRQWRRGRDGKWWAGRVGKRWRRGWRSRRRGHRRRGREQGWRRGGCRWCGGDGGDHGDSRVGGAGSSGVGGAVTPPVSDPTSTLGISAPGSGYHVEGNIPYGPYTMQRLDIIYPNAAGPKGTTTLPGVIMFHGGGWTDNKPAALKASMSSFFSRFLKHGFLVCNVEYRLADGTADGAIAPAADQDALLAAKWFWDHMDYYHVDKTRYVTTGASAGGQLALMVGMATPAAQLGPTSPTDYTIAAIVNGYGPADVTDLLAKNVSFAVQWLPANTPNRAAIAKEVSAVTYVRQDVPPLITVQGDMDTTVPMSESQELYDLLTAAGADTALHFVAGAGHGFTTPATAWPDAEAAMFNFLVAHGIGK